MNVLTGPLFRDLYCDKSLFSNAQQLQYAVAIILCTNVNTSATLEKLRSFGFLGKSPCRCAPAPGAFCTLVVRRRNRRVHLTSGCKAPGTSAMATTSTDASGCTRDALDLERGEYVGLLGGWPAIASLNLYLTNLREVAAIYPGMGQTGIATRTRFHCALYTGQITRRFASLNPISLCDNNTDLSVAPPLSRCLVLHEVTYGSAPTPLL